MSGLADSASLPVYGFDEAIPAAPAGLSELLGGKGAGLVEMRQRLGLPVPPGFVIGTPLCRQCLDEGWPDGLGARLDTAIAVLEQRSGRVFGGADDPLLVSVRSGARVSMPGMMDTILNLGANERTIGALARRTGSRRFALDTWLRFCRMYAKTVLGLPAEVVGEEPGEPQDEASLRAAIDTLQLNCEARGTPIPDEPREQLKAAILAVFRSCRSERARVYREREGIAGEVPTAVVVQAMVFGNLGRDSGTGVAFTRDPSSGEARPVGDFLPNAQGEAVVAGTHSTLPLEDMAKAVPEAHRELLTIMPGLERHFRDLCDIEFTVENGRLFVLQARAGKRSARAAVRLAVEMTRDPHIALSRAEAVGRISADVVRQLRSSAVVADGATAAAQGVGVSPGVVSGVVCTHPDRVAALVAQGRRVVLVREDTSPHDVHGMVASAAIVTATGGRVSHAALVARAWGIAAVCGVESLRFAPHLSLGGRTLHEGELVTVDGESGAVYFGDEARASFVEPPELGVLRQWAAELGLALGEAPASADPGADGVGTTGSGGSGGAGGAGDAGGDGGTAPPPPSDFALVRALGLAGFAQPSRLAQQLGVAPAGIEPQLASLPPGLASASPRGWHLTPQGRHWLAQALADERSRVDRAAAERVFYAFNDLDARLKIVITDWQLRPVDGQPVANDHSDQAYDDAVLARLTALHAQLAALWPEIVRLAPRLAPFERRFGRAMAAIGARDASMIASPLKDSYHTIWFELHEELIHLSGRDRAREVH